MLANPCTDQYVSFKLKYEQVIQTCFHSENLWWQCQQISGKLSEQCVCRAYIHCIHDILLLVTLPNTADMIKLNLVSESVQSLIDMLKDWSRNRLGELVFKLNVSAVSAGKLMDYRVGTTFPQAYIHCMPYSLSFVTLADMIKLHRLMLNRCNW